jgi:hypothetical protein
MLIRARFLTDVKGLNKVQCKPFLVEEIVDAAELMLQGAVDDREYLTPHEHAVKMQDQDFTQRL